ncbi:hypothetical protein J7L67_05275, partial [bacterium]|nr:hypothetical protein [bacterium]
METNFIIKPDWDQNINPPTNEKETGHFCGREKELNLLVNELKRRKNASILISGHRGVGKTSFVYKALWELKNKKEPIFVLLNASQLELLSKKYNKNDETNGNNIDLDKILENLIRRLYSATKTSKALKENIKEKIALLYYKAVASNYSETFK